MGTSMSEDVMTAQAQCIAAVISLPIENEFKLEILVAVIRQINRNRVGAGLPTLTPQERAAVMLSFSSEDLAREFARIIEEEHAKE